MTACKACGQHPCDGTHMHCDLDVYAAHRGLTIAQLTHQSRFLARREQSEAHRAFLKWLGPEPPGAA